MTKCFALLLAAVATASAAPMPGGPCSGSTGTIAEFAALGTAGCTLGADAVLTVIPNDQSGTLSIVDLGGGEYSMTLAGGGSTYVWFRLVPTAPLSPDKRLGFLGNLDMTYDVPPSTDVSAVYYSLEPYDFFAEVADRVSGVGSLGPDEIIPSSIGSILALSLNVPGGTGTATITGTVEELRALPEPSSVALLVSGIALFAVRRYGTK
jgi:hypothetical protein